MKHSKNILKTCTVKAFENHCKKQLKVPVPASKTVEHQGLSGHVPPLTTRKDVLAFCKLIDDLLILGVHILRARGHEDHPGKASLGTF